MQKQCNPCIAFAQLTIFCARYSSHVFDLSYAHPHCIIRCILPAAEVFPVKRTIKEKSSTA